MKIIKVDFHNTSRNCHKTSKTMQSPMPQVYKIDKTFPNIHLDRFRNINFRSINNKVIEYTLKMGERIYSKRNVTALSTQYKDASGITLGRGLPKEWLSRIKDFKNFNQEAFIKEFGNIFRQERVFSDVDALQNKLTLLFKKYSIIDDETPLSVKYIGQGFQAWAYKINIGNNKDFNVVTKLFKRTYNYLQNHGNHTEQNLAEYVRRYGRNNCEFATYYFGDTENGIILTNYISNKAKKSEPTAELTDIGLQYNDEKPENRKNGYIVDFGGLITDSNLIGNLLAINVHSLIKYAPTKEDKLKIFNEYYRLKNDSDIFKNIAIGLTHSIKYLPVELQEDLYMKMYELKSSRVNISLIQCIKYFKPLTGQNKISQKLSNLIEILTKNADNIKVQETIAKEIEHMPPDIIHDFFDKHVDTKVSAIIKYLSRHINLYYKPVSNRKIIYDKFLENSDRYAAISMINNMKYLSESRYDEYFERFYAKNDPFIKMTLARNLELFNNNEKMQKKWINKLMESNDIDVMAGLCESVSFVERDLRTDMFTRLLDTKDKVCKNFLAQNIITVPGYESHPQWIEKILDEGDNMLRWTLIQTIKKLPAKSPVRNLWLKLVFENSDESIKKYSKKILET